MKGTTKLAKMWIRVIKHAMFSATNLHESLPTGILHSCLFVHIVYVNISVHFPACCPKIFVLVFLSVSPNLEEIF